MLNFVSQNSPPITAAEIDEYPLTRSWDDLFDRAINHPSDDGHLQKCIRSLAFGERYMSEKWGKGDFQIKPDSWRKLANLGKPDLGGSKPMSHTRSSLTYL